MADEDAKAKLKELEKNLAKELDHDVRLSEPTDSRLNGSVEMNPQISKTAGPLPPPGPPPDSGTESANAMGPGSLDANKNKKNADEMALEEVDKLLIGLDADFKTSMDEIQSALKQDVQTLPALESIAIGTDYLAKDGEEETTALPTTSATADIRLDSSEVKGPRPHFIESVFVFLLKTLLLPLQLLWGLARSLAGALKEQTLKEKIRFVVTHVSAPLVFWKNNLTALLQLTLSYSIWTYAQVIILVVLSVGFYKISNQIVVNFKLADKQKDPFLRSFQEVAGSMEVIPEEDEGQDIESPLKHPEYTVLVHKVIANLKSTNPDDTPMVTAVMYLEASNQECAIEIHDREDEVRDIIDRTFEQTSPSELETLQGKVRFKIRLRSGLNRILNRGSVRGVFFKSINFSY